MMELLKIFGGFIGFMFVCVSVVVVVSWVMLMAVNDIDINTEFDETDNDFDSRDLL